MTTPPKKDKTVAVEATLANSHPISKSVETTTAESVAHTEDEQKLESKGQRWTSNLWETTQSVLALVIIFVALYIAVILALYVTKPDVKEEARAISMAAFLFVSNLASAVIGFYFGRTNHQKVGGVGGDTSGHIR